VTMPRRAVILIKTPGRRILRVACGMPDFDTGTWVASSGTLKERLGQVERSRSCLKTERTEEGMFKGVPISDTYTRAIQSKAES
jgi:hypothetical protein